VLQFLYPTHLKETMMMKLESKSNGRGNTLPIFIGKLIYDGR
jgi:hypothetical protein